MTEITGQSWTFLSNHAHVLIFLSGNPEARVSEVADAVGITERFTHKVIRELEAAGYLEVEKSGRRNNYRVVDRLKLRHPLEQHVQISSLLEIFPSR